MSSGKSDFAKSRKAGQTHFRTLRPPRATRVGIGEGITSRHDGRDEKRDKEEHREKENKSKNVGGPRSEVTFWHSLTATGGDVEVDKEGGSAQAAEITSLRTLMVVTGHPSTLANWTLVAVNLSSKRIFGTVA